MSFFEEINGIKHLKIIVENKKPTRTDGYGITPEYLLYALSHKLVIEQSQNKIFIDTTLPNIAERWQEIKIPVFNDEKQYEELKNLASNIINEQWKVLRDIDNLKKNCDVYNT